MKVYGIVLGSKEKDNLTFYTTHVNPADDWFEGGGLVDCVEGFPFLFHGKKIMGWRPKNPDGSLYSIFYFPFMEIDTAVNSVVQFDG